MITDRGRLVDRREELALIDAAFRDTEAGEPRFVLLAGDAGIGKTRLMEHVAERLAESGARVLHGGCVELGAEGLPLAPVTAVLRSLVREFGTGGLDELVPGASALTRLLRGDAIGTGPERARSFELIAAVLERLGGERPLVLAVDDLHWSDPSTRELLGFLARRLRAARVLALLAFRTDALGRRHPLRAFAAELARLPAVRRIDLPPFDRAGTAELLAAGSGGARPAEALVDRVYRASGGNPLFAAEVARAEGLPANLRDLLLSRFGELPDAARDVVALAAAGGPRVAHGLLAEVAGLPAPALLAGLRAAIDAHVLVADGDGYRFPHTLLYEAVVGELLPAERTALHRAYAAALERDPGLTSPDRVAAETAFHWAEAGDTDRALPALLRAADAAEAVGARAEQAHLLGRALDLWPRDGTDARFAAVERSLAAASWGGEHLRSLDRADRELVEETVPGRVALLHAHRGLALHNLGRDAALTAIDEAARALAGADPLPRARTLDMIAAVRMLRDRPGQALDAATEAMRLAAELDDPDLHRNASTTAGTVLARLGRYREALDALPVPGPAVAGTHAARVQLNRAEVLAALGRWEDAADAARAGLDAAHAAGLARTLGALLAYRLAAALAATGRLDAAAAEAAAALDADPPGGAGGMLHALHGELALVRGDLGLARERLVLARSLAGPEPGWDGVPADRLAVALALHDDRVADARAAIVHALAAPALTPAQVWPLLSDGARTEAQARLREPTRGGAASGGARPGRADGPADDGRAGVSGDLESVLAERAARLPVEGALCAAHAAEYAAATGTSGGSWAAAVAAWDAAGDPFAASRARLRAAEDAAASGDRAAAGDLLRAAARTADGLGARPLREEIGLVARAARVDLDGTPGPDAPAAGRLGLTGRELEVLRLITDGRSNRQIAEELFISPKTASVHVSRILGKLGASTRGEAAAAAHRLRLFA